jgi:type II secretory pathway component PulF
VKLVYEAYNRSGSVVSDVVEATNAQEAREQLRRSGLYVSAIQEEGQGASRFRDRTTRPSHGGRHLKNLAMSSRHLSVLLNAGIPLTQALTAVERQSISTAWRGILGDLRQTVEQGGTLSEAMAARPDVFSGVVQSLVATGESSGEMAAMFERVADITNQHLRLRRTVLSALIYPTILISIGCAVVCVMLLVVVPRFTELFESLGATLPATTAFLMSLSVFLRAYWWLLAALIVLGGVGAKIAVSLQFTRNAMERSALVLPVFGRLIKSLATSRIARLLGVLLSSRVPLLEALELAKGAAGLRCYTDVLSNAAESARTGGAISPIFQESSLIVPAVGEAMSHGEQNGQLAPILLDMADFLDEENESLVRTATSVLEPLILVGLGAVVGFIALSLFIPLFDLSAMTAEAR